jgi:pimeloyl-ACP methyl ester carboxylesterase
MPTKQAFEMPVASALQDAIDYGVDAFQRGVLYLDAMRKSGNQFIEHFREGKPPVLAFDYEVVMDGRNLERPVNYALLRIIPGKGNKVDTAKRPFVIFDPRAGHGPGIGGFKEASQVGVAMRAGHPCYFVSFYPDPVDGQTIEDIARAEARFVRKVMELHPEADGKPAIVGNCQAGWAIMLMSAMEPDLAGVICVAGSPLSYWAGARGQNPLRYMGGLMGGSWLASLAGDLGAGRFDGVHLVANFENLNPSNTLWSKQYNLYANIDTEEPRFLGFEKWWGGHFFLTTDEIRFIVDELFVGNKLARGRVVTSDGRRLDLKAIRAPIVVIASWGDNITPPQQALNWIPDLYRSVDEIRANEQVIVYTLHPTIGHLGIFVSAKVALKEHAEFVNASDLIEILPPGLYEMVIEEQKSGTDESAREHDEYIVRFEERTVDDILALDDGRQDEQAFSAVARISEINEGLYNTLVGPWVRMGANRLAAEWLRLMHPARLQRLMLSDMNPAVWPLQAMAQTVRENRSQMAPTNPFLQAQNRMSGQIEAALDRYRDARDAAVEQLFYAIYESPVVRAAAGLGSAYADENKPHARDEALEALLQKKVAAIQARLDKGGFAEAVMRILLAGTTAQRMIDVRGVRVAREAKQHHPVLSRLSRQEIKDMAREQAFLLAFARDRAIEALRKLLPTDRERREAMAFVHDVVKSKGSLRPEAAKVLHRIERVLGVEPKTFGRAGAAPRIPPPKLPALRAAPKRRRGNGGATRRRMAAEVEADQPKEPVQ